MDREKLIARRAEVLERHRTLESVPGSGWHKDDPSQREMRDKGFGQISERPIAIQDDDRVFFVGPDVEYIRDKIGGFLARADGRTIEETMALRHQHLQAEKQCRRILERVGDVIEMPTTDFNSVTYALTEVLGVLVVVTGMK